MHIMYKSLETELTPKRRAKGNEKAVRYKQKGVPLRGRAFATRSKGVEKDTFRSSDNGSITNAKTLND